MINLYDGQITDLLQNSLKHNPETQAIAYAVLQEKRRLIDLVERTRLMSAVDSLEERILDYLAVELRTPAYEDSLPLDTKRTLIKGTLPFYAKLGTPAAVDWVINTIFGNGGIEEWFDYGGEPHHFRICAILDHHVFKLKELEHLVRTVSHVKRLSSWLDEIIFTLAPVTATLHVGGGTAAQAWTGIPLEPDSYSFKDMLHIGGDFGAEETMGLPPGGDVFNFRDALHAGGTFSANAALSVPKDTGQLPATTILRTGGVCTIISNLSTGD